MEETAAAAAAKAVGDGQGDGPTGFASERAQGRPVVDATQWRGSNLDKLTVTQTIEVKVDAPAGWRHKATRRSSFRTWF
ncbi:MAG TPA: hypothetical protein VMI72_12680 [Roseiarcus sp.]|nr:hypothetical protein [Roseiarcus sp.]